MADEGEASDVREWSDAPGTLPSHFTKKGRRNNQDRNRGKCDSRRGVSSTNAVINITAIIGSICHPNAPRIKLVVCIQKYKYKKSTM